MWIYEGHMGSIYATIDRIDFEDLYCEECGDSDWEIGEAETIEDARDLLVEAGYYEMYDEDYLEEFLGQNFGAPENDEYSLGENDFEPEL